MLLLLGSWWLYLVFTLTYQLEDLNHPLIEGNLLNMIKWEGLSFFFFLIFLSFTLLYLHIQDHRKTKALQAFFSSLTHELKTPLASMKLQTEVLVDHLMHLDINNEEKDIITKYTSRFLNDNARLEDQLDSHLQLSRVERHAPVNLTPIQLHNFLKTEVKRFPSDILFDFSQLSDEVVIMADEFALKTIIRNLIDNSIKHARVSPLKISITSKITDKVVISYTDNGDSFTGEPKELGQLFYKHNSPMGSGIGIYIIKKLMQQMQGSCAIKAKSQVSYLLEFRGKDQ
ncbi:MAG: HAMP domain-containing histidine kinase [Halobacteriovoraceae bacterium]|nr:HAMP domain-containing histidine kinase [Halobacteriovoraceae bacterium]